MKSRVLAVIAAVFQLPVDGIDDDASPETLPQWDSSSHLNLMFALEDEFKIQLSEEEMMAMVSLSDVMTVLKSHLG
jgi:acyl carrier protein